MSNLKTVQIHLLDDGTLDCWFQYGDGPVTSFDPAQRPEMMKNLLGEMMPAALAAKVNAESKAAALQAENDAKDANIQEMMGQVENAAQWVNAAQARIAELSVFDALAGGSSDAFLPKEEPTVTTDAKGNVEVSGNGTLTDKTFNG